MSAFCFFRGVIALAVVSYLNKNTVELVLTPRIYALVGQEYNIYFDNIMNDAAEKYDFTVTSYIGELRKDCLRIIPTEAGEYKITITAYQNNVVKGEVSSLLIVADSEAGEMSNKKILFIGDSTTANGLCVSKLNENFDNDVMDITLLGTKGVGRNQHEGISGWTIHDYSESEGRDGNENAFWNPETLKFDFSYYMRKNGYQEVNYVFIALGINDIFSVSEEDLAEKCDRMILQLQKIINSIHEFNSNIKIGLAITIPPGNDQDAFGKAYGVTYTLWQYKRKNFAWNKILIDSFKDQEENNIYLIPINTNLDTYNNMGIENEKCNMRTDRTKTTVVANGNVHPAEEGYWQIADIYWFFLKSCERTVD